MNIIYIQDSKIRMFALIRRIIRRERRKERDIIEQNRIIEEREALKLPLRRRYDYDRNIFFDGVPHSRLCIKRELRGE